jgi:hypothetical protein
MGDVSQIELGCSPDSHAPTSLSISRINSMLKFATLLTGIQLASAASVRGAAELYSLLSYKQTSTTIAYAES